MSLEICILETFPKRKIVSQFQKKNLNSFTMTTATIIAATTTMPTTATTITEPIQIQYNSEID